MDGEELQPMRSDGHEKGRDDSGPRQSPHRLKVVLVIALAAAVIVALVVIIVVVSIAPGAETIVDESTTQSSASNGKTSTRGDPDSPANPNSHGEPNPGGEPVPGGEPTPGGELDPGDEIDPEDDSDMYDWVIKETEIDESGPTVDCSGDGFEELSFQTISGQPIYLKYLIVKNLANIRVMNFATVSDHCRSLNSTMWEVIQGEREWKAMLPKLVEAKAADVWLNAQVTGSCEYSESQCRDSEAGSGKGIDVSWPSNAQAKYTRLHRATSYNRNCTVVENNEPYLWTTEICGIASHPGLCVKRKCAY